MRRVAGRALLFLVAGVVLVAGPMADRIVIVKSARTITLVSGGQVLKKYLVALGTAPAGAKERKGDHKTQEGLYVINA